MKNTFSRNERLRKRKEFLEVYNRGSKTGARHFYLYFLEQGTEVSRLGITVSRKTGKTVIRNRIKRRLREIFRRNKSFICPPCDLVVNARRSAGQASFQELEEDFLKLVNQWSKR